ncbi:hypothetical protein Tco_0441615 [Tanacetum coccineum]
MSNSTYSNTSDLDDIELIMQAIKHDQSLQQNEAEVHAAAGIRSTVSMILLKHIVQRIETYIEIVHPLPDHFNFFPVRPDAKGLISFSVIVKCTSVIRQLAYDTSPDALDEYLQIG